MHWLGGTCAAICTKNNDAKHACVQVSQIHKLLVDASPNISHAAAELTSELLESLGEGLLSEVRHLCCVGMPCCCPFLEDQLGIISADCA